MKKRIIAIFSIICTIFMFCSCTQKTNNDLCETASQTESTKGSSEGQTEAPTTANTIETTIAVIEPNAVPDLILLKDASIAENTKYEITHNYDVETYVDDVLLAVQRKADFGTETTTYSYIYKYDKHMVSWELLKDGEKQGNSVISFDKTAYVNHSPFTGNTNDYHGCTYSISVQDIDMENMKVTVQYSLDFSSDSVRDLNESATFDLWYADNGEGPYFVIPYKRSMVVQYEMFFILSIDAGLQFAQ